MKIDNLEIIVTGIGGVKSAALVGNSVCEMYPLAVHGPQGGHDTADGAIGCWVDCHFCARCLTISCSVNCCVVQKS